MMFFEVFSAAFHYLRRNAWVTVLAVTLLALSVTAVATAFGLTSAVTLAESPFPGLDRLWAPLLSVRPLDGGPPRPARFSYPDFATFRRSQDVFDAVGAYVSMELPLTGAPGPERVRAELVTPDYLRALGARPVVGSLMEPNDDGRLGSAFQGKVLLSHRLWQRRFQGDPSIVGQPIEILGNSLQILGVLAPEFQGLSQDVDLWLDMGTLPKIAGWPDILTGTDYARLRVVARSRPEVEETEISRAVIQAGRAVAAERPERTWGEATAQKLAEARSDPDLRRFLTILLVAAGLVLLLACFNIAGLHLSRAAARVRDFAVRKALGATPRRIVAQVFVESGLLALAAAALGLAGTHALTRYVVATLQTDWVWESSSPDVARLMNAGVSPVVVGFVVAVTFFITLMAGIVPALAVSRRDTARDLREGVEQIVGGSGRVRSLGRRALVAAQAAVAVALLSVAGLLFQDLAEMLRIDLEFDEQAVQILHITSSTRYGPTEAPVFHQRLIEEVGRLPSVESAALGSCIPLSCGRRTPVHAVEDGSFDPSSAPTAGAHFVSPGYFRTLGISLLAGRDFTRADTRETQRVVVVSQSVADRLWPDQDAIGRRLSFGGDGEPAEVVGIVANARQQSLFDVPEDVYVADYQNGAAWGVLFVKTRTDGTLGVAPLRDVLRRVDPGLPFEPAGSLEEHVSRVSSRSRYSSGLVSAVSFLALLLTVLGVYGVAALAVTARARELALRLVVGANHGEILRNVLAHGLRPVALGLVLAAPIAWAVSRRIHLSAVDPHSALFSAYLVAAAVVVVGALLASLPPARRTLSIEPSVTLREGP